MSAPTRPRRDDGRRHAARPLSDTGLSLGRPFPPDEQDAGGDLSRARPLREARFVRERLDRCDRRIGSVSIRSKCAGATSSRQPKCRSAPARSRSARSSSHDSGDYVGLLDKALGADGWDELQADLRARRAGGRSGRRGRRHVRGEERAWPRRRRAHRGRHLRARRGRDRRRVDRPGVRDGDGAGLRPRCSASTTARPRHPRPDRPASNTASARMPRAPR